MYVPKWNWNTNPNQNVPVCVFIEKNVVQGRDSNCDRGAAGKQGHNLFCGRRGAPDMAWIWISAGYGLDMDICLIQAGNMEGTGSIRLPS